MKKLSVQFNLTVDDRTTHKEIREIIKYRQDIFDVRDCIYEDLAKITSIHISDIKKGN